jgi:uncharacterized membrane protein YqjE
MQKNKLLIRLIALILLLLLLFSLTALSAYLIWTTDRYLVHFFVFCGIAVAAEHTYTELTATVARIKTGAPERK